MDGTVVATVCVAPTPGGTRLLLPRPPPTTFFALPGIDREGELLQRVALAVMRVVVVRVLAIHRTSSIGIDGVTKPFTGSLRVRTPPRPAHCAPTRPA